MVWSDIAGALITVAGNAIASRSEIGSVEQGNADLIATLQSGQELALEEIRQGKTEAFGFLDEGREATLATLAPLLISGQAGERVLRREALADSSALTPSQRIGLEEAQRISRNQLATSGLRGAGRTQAAVLKEVTDSFIAKAQDSNRDRSLAAADRLFGTGASALSAAANTEFGTGTAKAGAATGAGLNAAGVIESTASQIGGSQASTGQITGGIKKDAIVDTGKVLGETLGTIASEIAEDKKRTSAFANFKPETL